MMQAAGALLLGECNERPFELREWGNFLWGKCIWEHLIEKEWNLGFQTGF